MAESSIGYLFDECISPKLVSMLRLLGVKGLHTMSKVREQDFGLAAKDEDWIPRAAERGYIYVTLDRKQLVDASIASVFHQVKGRAVFLSSRYATVGIWDQARWMLKHWPDIQEATTSLERGSVRFVSWSGQVREEVPTRT